MAQPKGKRQGCALPLQRDPFKCVESGRSGEVGAPMLRPGRELVGEGPWAWRGPGGRWQAETRRWQERTAERIAVALAGDTERTRETVISG